MNAKKACITKLQEMFREDIKNIQHRTDSKLLLYSQLKSQCIYEKYLNCKIKCIPSFTKFRLSAHNLPIERGRYVKPKIPRNLRACPYCNLYIGTEYHTLMECNSTELRTVRDTYLNKIKATCPQLNNLNKQQQFLYIMTGHDIDIMENVFL
jgi:hypothetical protein